jgi:hypothetical protein
LLLMLLLSSLRVYSRWPLWGRYPSAPIVHDKAISSLLRRLLMSHLARTMWRRMLTGCHLWRCRLTSRNRLNRLRHHDHARIYGPGRTRRWSASHLGRHYYWLRCLSNVWSWNNDGAPFHLGDLSFHLPGTGSRLNRRSCREFHRTSRLLLRRGFQSGLLLLIRPLRRVQGQVVHFEFSRTKILPVRRSAHAQCRRPRSAYAIGIHNSLRRSRQEAGPSICRRGHALVLTRRRRHRWGRNAVVRVDAGSAGRGVVGSGSRRNA